MMTNKLISRLKTFIVAQEGVRHKPYRCTAGKLTIGVGRNLEDKGLNHVEVMFMLENDLLEADADLRCIFPKWDELDEERRIALISMRHNLGLAGLQDFKKMIAAIHIEDWKLASYECTNSKAARQLPNRYQILSEMLFTGHLPSGVIL